ncbi:MAG: serine/threonine-protein kinase [Gammaproteobacteria bacterium]
MSATPVRVLVLDDARRGAAVIARYVQRAVPEAEIETRSTASGDAPRDPAALAGFDVVVTGACPTAPCSGLDLAAASLARGEPPAFVLLLDRPDQAATARAFALGVREVLVKRDLDAIAIGTAVSAAATPLERTSTQIANDADVVARASDAGADGYRFARLIGQGGASRVYLGERIADGLTVVLKILDGTLSQDEEIVQRFIREAALARAIDSPHVVRIYDQGFTNRYGFIAMEFFSRGDLAQRIRLGLDVATVRRYLLGIARGLAAIHGAGIIHRDLKPANIMFRGDDELAIADFGISKRIDGDITLTRTGGALGTPYYMSPEQVSAKPLDHRADLYSAGIILYEMLTGQRPFVADSLPVLAMKHLKDEPPALPAAAAALTPLYRRLLAKDPADRLSSADELVAALGALRGI